MTRGFTRRIRGAVVAVLSAAGLSVSACVQARALVAAACPEVSPPAVALAGSPGQQQVIDAVEKRYHAKVVRVTETTVNGRPALELRLLSDQRVWNVVVDSATGQELSRS